MHANADDLTRAGIQAKAVEYLFAVFFVFNVKQNFLCARWNAVRILSDGLDIYDECCWLAHTAASVKVNSDKLGADSVSGTCVPEFWGHRSLTPNSKAG
jgi:hypothetical protein